MSSVTKIYHRGNDDVAEGLRLTAIFKITLTADTSDCATTVSYGEYLFDFIGGGSDYVGRRTTRMEGRRQDLIAREVLSDADAHEKTDSGGRELILREPQDWEGVFIRVPPGKCVGVVKINLDVDVSSPNGLGNGEKQAGPIASRFGLEHGGAFHKFNGGPNAPGSEHWRVNKSIDLGTVPCDGGTLAGTVKINSGLGVPPSYEINYDVTVVACGSDTLKLALVAKPRPGIGPGGIAVPPLTEVKDGDPLPYPLKAPPAGGQVVGPDGQPKPAP